MEEKLPKKYFSVDVETSGAHPLVSSMLSFGAVVVGDKSKTFYAELKPINKNYNLDAIKIGSSGLNSLKGYDFNNFNPEEAMYNFYHWVKVNSIGFKPIFCAAPVMFDGSFISHYFFKFLEENPFEHSGEDMQSMFRGSVRDLSAHFEELHLRDKERLIHNALEDALIEEQEFWTVLVNMRQHQNV